jgi:hypothetical protein
VTRFTTGRPHPHAGGVQTHTCPDCRNTLFICCDGIVPLGRDARADDHLAFCAIRASLEAGS